jgi:hypothetical protein
MSAIATLGLINQSGDQTVYGQGETDRPRVIDALDTRLHINSVEDAENVSLGSLAHSFYSNLRKRWKSIARFL